MHSFIWSFHDHRKCQQHINVKRQQQTLQHCQQHYNDQDSATCRISWKMQASNQSSHNKQQHHPSNFHKNQSMSLTFRCCCTCLLTVQEILSSYQINLALLLPDSNLSDFVMECISGTNEGTLRWCTWSLPYQEFDAGKERPKMNYL